MQVRHRIVQVTVLKHVIYFLNWNEITETQACTVRAVTWWFGLNNNQPSNSMENSLSWEANSNSANEEIPRLLWNLQVFHKAHHWSLFWVTCIQATPSHFSSLRSILILLTRLHLDFQSGVFPSGFPINMSYKFLISTVRATCPAHIILDLITQIIRGEAYKLWSSSLCSLL